MSSNLDDIKGQSIVGIMKVFKGDKVGNGMLECTLPTKKKSWSKAYMA